MVKLLPQQFKALRSMHKGLIHPVFHVSMLKSCHEDKKDPSRGESHRAPPIMTKSYDKEIEEVFARRVKRRRGVPPSIQYLIKWKGRPQSEATWEIMEYLWQFQDRLHLFEATRTSPD
ncbi:hypothetical protein ACP275_11G037300 [Erythranthe tilingii]